MNGQGRTVGVTDDVDGAPSPNACQVLHRQAHGCGHVLPAHRHQPGGGGTVPGNTQAQHCRTGIVQALPHLAQAVGGIGQAVQQQHQRPRIIAFQQITAVPVRRPARRVRQAAALVAIDSHRARWLGLGIDLAIQLRK